MNNKDLRVIGIMTVICIVLTLAFLSPVSAWSTDSFYLTTDTTVQVISNSISSSGFTPMSAAGQILSNDNSWNTYGSMGSIGLGEISDLFKTYNNPSGKTAGSITIKWKTGVGGANGMYIGCYDYTSPGYTAWWFQGGDVTSPIYNTTQLPSYCFDGTNPVIIDITADEKVVSVYDTSGSGLLQTETLTFGECYQESANVSTTCGGLSTGNYRPGGWGEGWNGGNSSLVIDGDWDTYSNCTNYGIGCDAYFYVNYTKPTGATKALWEVKYGGSPVVYENYSIPQTCWDYLPDKLMLFYRSDDAMTGPTVNSASGYCYNATSPADPILVWNSSDTGGRNVYEEAIVWNITSPRRYLAVPSTVSYLTTGRFNLAGFAPSSGGGLAMSPFSYWNMDEGTGTLVQDYFSINNGTLTGTWATGIIGGATNYSSAASNQMVILDSPSTNFDKGNATISFWFHPNTAVGAWTYISKRAEAGGVEPGFRVLYEDGTHTKIGFSNGQLVTNPEFTAGNWYHLVLRRNGTDVSLWINGTNYGSVVDGGNATNTYDTYIGSQSVAGYSDARFDEVGMWNRSLSDAEIVSLYNNGNGLPLSPASTDTINITIGSDVISTSVVAKGTTALEITLSNLASVVTAYLTAPYLVGSYYMVPFTFISEMAGNGTYSALYFTDEGYSLNSQTGNNTVYETSMNNYTLNLSFNRVQYPLSTVDLVFNGVPHTATTTYNPTGAIYAVTIPMPSVSTSTQFPYFWDITLTNRTTELNSIEITDGLGNLLLNTTVIPINLSACTSGNITLNFTAYDEQTLERLSPFTFQGTFNIWLGDGSTYKNVSINNLSSDEIDLCIFPINLTYYTDAIIQYSDVGASFYQPRNYYFYHLNLANTMQKYSLYLLNKTSSTSFIMNLLDQNNLIISGALIYSQRYYPGEGIYRTVQIDRTDASGNTMGLFETETPNYQFIIKKNGQTLLTTVPQKVVPTSVPYTLYFQIGQNLQSPWNVYSNMSDFKYSGPSYDNNTGMISYSYTDTSGITSYVRMVVSLTNYTGRNNVICDVNSTDIIGTLSCDVSGVKGTVQVSVVISRHSEDPIVTVLFTIGQLIQDVMGRIGYFMGWLIILTGFMVALYNPTAGILVGNVCCWLVTLFGLITFGPIFLIGLLALSIFVIVELNT